MRSTGSKKLFEYWSRLKGTRLAPERSEIEPSDIRELLGDTFILEINSTMKTICFRLAGTRLCSIYGRELKGYGYLGLWDEAHNLTTIRCINKAYMDYTASLISHKGKTASGRTVSFETLLLPLLPTSSDSARVLGICSVVEKPPFWLGSEPIVSNTIVKVRELPGVEVPSQTTTMAPDLEHLDLIGSSTDQPAMRQRGHLTVIDGGRND